MLIKIMTVMQSSKVPCVSLGVTYLSQLGHDPICIRLVHCCSSVVSLLQLAKIILCDDISRE